MRLMGGESITWTSLESTTHGQRRDDEDVVTAGSAGVVRRLTDRRLREDFLVHRDPPQVSVSDTGFGNPSPRGPWRFRRSTTAGRPVVDTGPPGTEVRIAPCPGPSCGTDTPDAST